MSPMVTIFILLLIVLPLSIYLLYLIYAMIKNTDSGLKCIVFGLHVSLVGGIVILADNIDFNGFEYIIVIFGLIISIVGMRKDK